MTIQVLLFGACREAASGTGEMSLDLVDSATVATVWADLSQRYPGLARFKGNVLFAVNEEYAQPEKTLAHGDILAIFPPVSGG